MHKGNPYAKQILFTIFKKKKINLKIKNNYLSFLLLFLYNF